MKMKGIYLDLAPELGIMQMNTINIQMVKCLVIVVKTPLTRVSGYHLCQ